MTTIGTNDRVAASTSPSFLLVLVSLGAVRPHTRTLLVVGALAALITATMLTVVLPRLNPWTPAAGKNGKRRRKGEPLTG